MKANITNILLGGILISLCYVGFQLNKVNSHHSSFEIIPMRIFDNDDRDNTYNPVMMNRETGRIYEMEKNGNKYKWVFKMGK